MCALVISVVVCATMQPKQVSYGSPSNILTCELIPPAMAVIFAIVTEERIAQAVDRLAHMPREYACIVFYQARSPNKSRANHAASRGVRTNVAILNVQGHRNDFVQTTMEKLSRCAATEQEHAFFFHADVEAFVSASYLKLLSSTSTWTTIDGRQRAVIIGKASSMRNSDDGPVFCTGGLGVAYSRTIMQNMKGKWAKCTPDGDSDPSKFIQSCIHRIANSTCTHPPAKARLMELHRRDIEARLVSAASLYDNVHPDYHIATSDVVYPLVTDESFRRVCQAALRRLAPPMMAHQMMRYAHTSSDSLCVVNKFAQRQVSSCTVRWNGDGCSFELPRCRHGLPLQQENVFAAPMFILSMESLERSQRFDATKTQLIKAGMSNIVRVMTPQENTDSEFRLVADWARKRFGLAEKDDRRLLKLAKARKKTSSADPDYVPTDGEIAFRAAMKRAIVQALEEGLEYFFVGDDDIVPSKSLRNELVNLMTNGCGRYMTRFAGLLLLGSSEWNQRWKEIDPVVYDGCYDLHDRTFGSFAVFYNADGARMVLEQLEDRPNIPGDHAFYLAALQGTFAATAMPNLFIVDHRAKKSAVNDGRDMRGRDEMDVRAEYNRWDVSRYAFAPQTFLDGKKLS